MTRRAPLREIPFEVFDRFMSEAPPDLSLSLDPEAVCPCGAHEDGEHARGCPITLPDLKHKDERQ